MNREVVLASVFTGVAFGLLQTLSIGPLGGLVNGCFVGIGTTLLLWKFTASQSTRHRAQLSEEILLSGESVLGSWPANLVIEPKEFGLQRLAGDGLLWTIGLKNRESLGGVMYLTNYRIVFKTHRFNRLRGVTSIFLPSIEQLDNHTVSIFRRLTVQTATGRVGLVIGDVDPVIAEIRDAAESLKVSDVAALRAQVAGHPERCSVGLEPWELINRLNDMIHLGRRAASTAGALVNPMAAIGAMFVSEFLEQPITDRWQQIYRSIEHRNAETSRRNTAA